MRRVAILALLMTAAGTPGVLSQAPAPSVPAGPTFEVVSIKRSAAAQSADPIVRLSSSQNQRPDGGFTMTNIAAGTLIARAYPPAVPADMIGLPDWVMSERYDVSATSSLSRATPEQQTEMLRAMLAGRFKLVAHFEKRDEELYHLVLARSDRRLGPGIKPSEVDCVAKAAADRAAAEAAKAAGTPPPPRQIPDMRGPVPPCTVRMTGPRMEGDMTMASLANFLRPAAGRWVIDKTGLAGSYRVVLEYDRMASIRGPDATITPGGPPAVTTAVQEQLGMRLESARDERERLVIDRIERPTEN
jgi:uncharacterized protein (TIGR03435 family)